MRRGVLETFLFVNDNARVSIFSNCIQIDRAINLIALLLRSESQMKLTTNKEILIQCSVKHVTKMLIANIAVSRELA